MPEQTKGLWARIDDKWASFESALAIAMLLLMIVVAFAQALLRNLTQQGFHWANAALEWLDWADFILSKGTLWVAFLGASLAVHSDKHVAIDIMHRFVSPKARLFLRALVGSAGFVICAFLARAFWDAVAVNGMERPANFDVMTSQGAIHLCDASAAQLAELQLSKPPYCVVRSVLSVFGAQMETPGAAFQLIVPVMFAVMSIRMLANALRDFGRFGRGDVEDDDPSAHGLTGAAHEVAEDLHHTEGR